MKLLPKFDLTLSAATLLLLHCLLCWSCTRAERDFNFNDSQVPLLEPKDEPLHTHYIQDPYAVEISRCHAADSEVILSLVLKNHDWDELSDNKKAKVMEKLSKFFAIPKEFIVMESVTKYDLSEMQKESIRKGNNKCHNSNRRLGRVSFVVRRKPGEIQPEFSYSLVKLGCGATYFTISEPITKQIGAQVKDGSLDNITGEKFGWWVIWRKHLKTRAQRNRRQIEGSGGHDFTDDDDYEYGDDEEDVVGTVTEVPAVTTHAHRHHHGVAQPELTENKLELESANHDLSAAAGEQTAAATIANTNGNDKSADSGLLLLNKNGNIDEEIVEGVSQLESVITKTIENTKNIKDLPVVVDEEAEEEDDDVPVAVEIVKESEAPSALEELDRELESKTADANAHQLTLATAATATATATATTTAPMRATHTSGITKKTQNLIDDNDDNDDDADDDDADVDADVDIDADEGSGALEPSAPLNRNINGDVSARVDNINSLASASAPVHVAEVIESPSTVVTEVAAAAAAAVPPTSSQPAAVAVGLDRVSSAIGSTPTTTITSASTAHSSATTVPSAFEPRASTSLSPQSSSSALDASFVSASSPTSHAASSYSPSLSSPPLSASSPSSSSPSSSSSLSPSTSTTVTPATTTSATTLPTKDGNETSTVSPPDNQSINATAQQHITPEVMDVYGAAGSASSPSTPSASSTSPTSPTSSASAPTSTTTSADNTSPSTDYVEPKQENSPPLIHSRLQKLAVTSGKSFTFTVPQDTFYDAEDLTNLRLELTDKDGHELKPSSWLQFNPETRVISGLPLDDAVSKWQYRLSATDSGNESVTETLELTVQQHRGVRTVNHEVNIAVKINEKNMPSIVWQLKLMRAIATTLGDDNTYSLVVREIRQMSQDPNLATFVYFNETLLTSECPESELNNLVKRLDANRLSDLVRPVLGIKSITGQLIGPCQKTHVVKPKPAINMSNNISPIPRNQVDRVNATIGHLLVYKVPSDTFYDPNDNEPLTLTLKTKDHKELNPRHWLQFDSKNQEFYGIPKGGDVGSEEYLLVAEDAGGLTATDALVVVVSHAPKKEFSVYFKAYLAIRHEQFNADLQRKFVERIAQLFGDPTTQYVQIRSVTTHHDSDGTIVNFYNTTLFKSHNRCPEEEIEAVRSVYLIKDYLLRDNVQKALGPELNLTNVQAMPLGICHPQTDVTHREFVPTKTEEPTLKSTFGEEYMYTVILPAVIIVVMIVIGLSIACCLHRRRHKSGKMELGDEEERKSFRTKGIPVIFQDELDEKPEIGNKSPIILKDEKPPLLPPSYNTSNMNGDNDVDEYVPPPAVVVGGREVRGKSPATPSYRKPPPYVSP